MIRLCAGLFLWLALSLSAAAGTMPETGHDEDGLLRRRVRRSL